jgi:hypothetical protein
MMKNLLAFLRFSECSLHLILIFSPGDTPAVDAYKYAYKVLDCFIEPTDKYGFKKFKPICHDVLGLYDYIRINYAKEYNEPDETGKRGRYGATIEAKGELEKKRGLRKRTTYYFYNLAEPVIGGNACTRRIRPSFD